MAHCHRPRLPSFRQRQGTRRPGLFHTRLRRHIGLSIFQIVDGTEIQRPVWRMDLHAMFSQQQLDVSAHGHGQPRPESAKKRGQLRDSARDG